MKHREYNGLSLLLLESESLRGRLHCSYCGETSCFFMLGLKLGEKTEINLEVKLLGVQLKATILYWPS